MTPPMTNPTEQARELWAAIRQEELSHPDKPSYSIRTEMLVQAIQSARDEERERSEKLYGLLKSAWGYVRAHIHEPGAIGLLSEIDMVLAIRAQAPSPTDSPARTDAAETVPPGKPDPSEYARGVRAAADLCESEAVRNREAERNVPALTYRVAARQILALLPKREGAE